MPEKTVEIKTVSDISKLAKEVTSIKFSLKCLKDIKLCEDLKQAIPEHVSAVSFQGSFDDYLLLVESPRILEVLLPKHILHIQFDTDVLDLDRLNRNQQKQLIDNLPDFIKQINFYSKSHSGYKPSDELIKHIIDKNMILSSHRASYRLLYLNNCLVLSCYEFINMGENSFKEKIDSMPEANKLRISGLVHYSDHVGLMIEKLKMLDKRFTLIDLQANDLLCFGPKIVQLIEALPDSVKCINILGNGFENCQDVSFKKNLFNVLYKKNIALIAEHTFVHKYNSFCKGRSFDMLSAKELELNSEQQNSPKNVSRLSQEDKISLDKQGRTPLYLAVLHHGAKEVISLLDQGADISSKTNSGETLLHSFAWRVMHNDHYVNENTTASTVYDLEILKLLVPSKIDINAKNLDKEVALHLLIRLMTIWEKEYDHSEIIKYLLAQGADVTIENRYGKKPIDYAIKGSPEYHLLENKMKEILKSKKQFKKEEGELEGKDPIKQKRSEPDKLCLEEFDDDVEKSGFGFGGVLCSVM